MDWSIVGRETKKVVTDVIDQSLGTHFFRSSTPVTPNPSQTASNPETNPQNPTTPVENKINPEEQKALELKQKAQADSVRAELEAAIATQRQKRLAEQQQVEQIRLESLAKAGPQTIEQKEVEKTSEYSKPTSEQFDAKTRE